MGPSPCYDLWPCSRRHQSLVLVIALDPELETLPADGMVGTLGLRILMHRIPRYLGLDLGDSGLCPVADRFAGVDQSPKG